MNAVGVPGWLIANCVATGSMFWKVTLLNDPIVPPDELSRTPSNVAPSTSTPVLNSPAPVPEMVGVLVLGMMSWPLMVRSLISAMSPGLLSVPLISRRFGVFDTPLVSIVAPAAFTSVPVVIVSRLTALEFVLLSRSVPLFVNPFDTVSVRLPLVPTWIVEPTAVVTAPVTVDDVGTLIVPWLSNGPSIVTGPIDIV